MLADSEKGALRDLFCFGVALLDFFDEFRGEVFDTFVDHFLSYLFGADWWAQAGCEDF